MREMLRFPRCSMVYWTAVILNGETMLIGAMRLSTPAATVCEQGTSGTVFDHLATSRLCSNLNNHRLHHCVHTTERGASRRPVLPLRLVHPLLYAPFRAAAKKHVAPCYAYCIYSSAQQSTCVPSSHEYACFSPGTPSSRCKVDHHRIFLAESPVFLSMPCVYVMSAHFTHRISKCSICYLTLPNGYQGRI